MSGYTSEEMISQTPTQLSLWLGENYEQAMQLLLKNGSLHNQECQLRTKTGGIRTVLLSIELIEISGVQCTLNILNDITERKRLENEFISLVSHELRTPMNSIIGALDLVATQKLGTLTPKGQQVINIAISNTERLIRLVNDILDLERMKSGKIDMKKIKCNPADLMQQATAAMQQMADTAQITLKCEPINVYLWADPDRILQTLTNLLSNAIKFSEPGKTIWLRSQIKSNNLQITVEDQGRGIPTEKQQLIFERFQQVDASDSREKGGTGLGLSICRSIVEQHHGKIWTESNLGKGSTFYINLPLEQACLNVS